MEYRTHGMSIYYESIGSVDNAGHALQIEQPELFGCLIKEWLERVINSEMKDR